MRKRALAVVGLAAALASAPLATDLRTAAAGRGLDYLMPLARATGLGMPGPSRVAIVAIDEESYRSPPFSGLPKVAWTPQIGRVLSAIGDGGASVIGFDAIFPTTLDADGLIRNYDRPWLQTLLKLGRQSGRLILARAGVGADPIEPARTQRVAIGEPNIREIAQLLDDDEVVRRYPVTWPTSDGGTITSFGAELAKRAGADLPDRAFVLRPEARPGTIPIYSLVDILGCAEAGDAGFLERAFKDRVVLVAEALEIEDRRTSANRLAIDGRLDPPTARCVKPTAPASTAAPGPARRTIPGVYLHAMAINTLLAKSAPIIPGVAGSMALCLILSAAAGIAATTLGPALIILALLGLSVVTYGGSLLAYDAGWLTPYPWLIAAAILSAVMVFLWRFVVEDQEKRRVARAFRHYLAPALVERLSRDAGALSLGGERRRVAVFFSDIAGFTAVSEKLRDEPERLVAILNAYTTVIADQIEAHGGYVDKFIGDSVMAIWNAPVPDDEPDRHAVAAAVECVAALERFNREVLEGEHGLPAIGTRIGINSGVAIAGNMGSSRRFNYTVTGDVVNLAARLESANKAYGTTILIGEATARGCGPEFLMRRIDRAIVKGKSLPVRVYEVVGRRDAVAPEAAEHVRRFHAALGLFLRRRFTEAAAAFAAMADEDETAGVYQARALAYADHPPPARWDRAWTLESK